MSIKYPVILSIAGSDSSGGAGIQADLKTATAFGVYAMTAITAITAQNTCGVTCMEPVSPWLLKSQLEAVAEDIMPDVVKIGLIPNAASANVIADFLEKVRVPVVADPVISSTSGHLFSSSETLDVMRTRIFPLVALLTPNIPETGMIIGREVTGRVCFTEIAEEIIERFGCKGVLVKGGHAEGDILTDILLVETGEDGDRYRKEFRHPRVETKNTHGTGCTLSSAIASFMAQGLPVSEAVGYGIEYLLEVLNENSGIRIGNGNGPVGQVWRDKNGCNKSYRHNEGNF